MSASDLLELREIALEPLLVELVQLAIGGVLGDEVVDVLEQLVLAGGHGEAHGLLHDRVVEWLSADSDRARFYNGISKKTREWSADRRGDHWFAADALGMAIALEPDGVLEDAWRPLVVELGHGPARGMTVVDWRREGGRPDRFRLLLRYDQARFEGLIRAALAAG